MPADFDNAAGRAVDNLNAVQFPKATENQGNITHWGLFSASAGGIYIAGGDLTTPKTVDTDQQLTVFANQLIVSFLAGDFTDYLANALLDHLMMKTAMTQPAALFIGASSTTPNDAGGNVTEPAGGDGYARQETVFNAAVADDPSFVCTNNGAEQFGPAANNPWAITHGLVYDALTGGNLLAYGALTGGGTINVAVGEPLDVPDTAFKVKLL